ncbi:MAG TPA: chromate transporter [Spirochaetia bacterium]|nr:chromate transporter [Spirochaetia bacterium]
MPGWREVARVYLKIGTVGFGGGYAVMTLIHDELVTRRGWLNEQRYDNMLSLAELAPGALTVNLLAVIAYRLGGVRTMLLATGALIMPSFLLILLLAGALLAWEGVPVVRGALEGLTAGVVGLMLAVAWELTEKFPHRWYYYAMGAAALAASFFLHLDPIWLILAGALAGGGKAFFTSRRETSGKKPEGGV